MSKGNIKLGMVSLLLISSIFVLSGCTKKNQEKNQSQDQSQNKEQAQVMNQNGESENKKENPSTEMASVCSGKTEGDSCEATMPARNKSNDTGTDSVGGSADNSNKITGTCKKMTNGETLVCMPDGMPSRGSEGSGSQERVAPDAN